MNIPYNGHSAPVLGGVPLSVLLDELQSRVSKLLDGHRIYFPPRAAADFLGVSERTLFEFTQPRGPIPCIKLGSRLVKYDRMDLIAFMDQAKQQAEGGDETP